MTTDRPFSEQLRYERDLRGWSQAELAEKIECDQKTIGRWERGKGIPRPYYRQRLSELFEKDAKELGLLGENLTKTSPASPADHTIASSPCPREDWSEAPDVVPLYGREEELAILARSIKVLRSRVVAIVGVGGVGKTAVAAGIARQVKQDFEYVFWRSLHNAPPPEIFLRQYIAFLSHQHYANLPGNSDDQISVLISLMRDHRCLLLLDNFDSVLAAGQSAGRFRDGYAAYGRLLQCVGETSHASCLLITSREKPKEVAQLEGKNSPVRSLQLSGLPLQAGQQILQDKDLSGSDIQWHALVERYSGNPLALRLVSEPIQELFAGNIGRFLEEETLAFGDINDVLAQQFERLSAQERDIMYWLAIERESVSLDDLHANLARPTPRGILFETLSSLRRRSLIEPRGPTQFTLQPVIMEYVTMRLVEQACEDFDVEIPETWIQFALCKAQAKDYVRDSQVRLLLAPIAQRLLARFDREGIRQRASNMLDDQRQHNAQQPGYLAGNLLNLLSHLRVNLRGMDFSHLVIRQAYLQGTMLPGTNFACAHFISSLFSNTFGNILSVACSPLRHTAAGTSNGDILIYDNLSGMLCLTYRGHTDGTWSLAFSPDGSLLASGSDDSNVRLWDCASGECLDLLQEHTNRVRSIAFSPDGSTLASGSDDQTIRVWDTRSSRCLQTLTGHSDRVWSVAYSPDGKLLASGSTDQTVRLWDMQAGSCLMTLQGHGSRIRAVAFDSGGRIIASGSDDATIRLWDAGSGKHLRTLYGHNSRVWSVASHPTKSILASGSEDQTIRLWDILSGHCIMLLQGHHAGVRSVKFTANGELLVSGGDDQTVRVWDASSGHCLRMMQGHTRRVWAIAYHPDSSLLASISEDAAIRLWDTKSGQYLSMWQDSCYDALAIAFHPHGSMLASGGQNQTVHVWDINNGRGLLTLRGHTNWVRTVIFSPDGKLLASGSEDETIRLYDASSGACLRILRGHTSWVRSLAFSPDGAILASGADDNTVRLWDPATGSQLRALDGHTGRVRTIAFHPDGKLLASGSEDGTIRLWNPRIGSCLAILQGYAGRIRSIAFSPGGKLLASGGDDTNISLWDIPGRRCFQVLQGHTQRVRWVAFSPNGHMLSSSSDDGTIRCWDTQSYLCLHTLIAERPYEGMNISHARGLTDTQKANLQALGAIEEG